MNKIIFHQGQDRITWDNKAEIILSRLKIFSDQLKINFQLAEQNESHRLLTIEDQTKKHGLQYQQGPHA